MNVFVTGAEFGVVRYIGQTEFSEGVWLGIELRRPSEWILFSISLLICALLNCVCLLVALLAV